MSGQLAPAERRVVRALSLLCLFALLWHIGEGLRPPPPPLVIERGALLPARTPADSVLYAPGSPVVHVPGPDHPLDLRTVGTDSLESIPGIGPVLAARIAAWRETKTDTIRVDDLLEVQGIGPVLLERIRPFLRGGDGGFWDGL